VVRPPPPLSPFSCPAGLWICAGVAFNLLQPTPLVAPAAWGIFFICGHGIQVSPAFVASSPQREGILLTRAAARRLRTQMSKLPPPARACAQPFTPQGYHTVLHSTQMTRQKSSLLATWPTCASRVEIVAAAERTQQRTNASFVLLSPGARKPGPGADWAAAAGEARRGHEQG
jgi:hypothetical protein